MYGTIARINFFTKDHRCYIFLEKILTKIGYKLDMLQAIFWLFFCWDILLSARCEVGRKKFGQKVPNVLRMVRGGGAELRNVNFFTQIQIEAQNFTPKTRKSRLIFLRLNEEILV